MGIVIPSSWYILVRPKMYTVSGTLGEVVAFIDGYVSGVNKSPKEFEAPIVDEWHGFTEWLREKLPEGQPRWIDAFVERYGNDEDGLTKLREYFNEYTSLPHRDTVKSEILP